MRIKEAKIKYVTQQEREKGIRISGLETTLLISSILVTLPLKEAANMSHINYKADLM